MKVWELTEQLNRLDPGARIEIGLKGKRATGCFDLETITGSSYAELQADPQDVGADDSEKLDDLRYDFNRLLEQAREVATIFEQYRAMLDVPVFISEMEELKGILNDLKLQGPGEGQ